MKKDCLYRAPYKLKSQGDKGKEHQKARKKQSFIPFFNLFKPNKHFHTEWDLECQAWVWSEWFLPSYTLWKINHCDRRTSRNCCTDGAAGTASSRQAPASPKLNSQFSAVPFLNTVLAWVRFYLSSDGAGTSDINSLCSGLTTGIKHFHRAGLV